MRTKPIHKIKLLFGDKNPAKKQEIYFTKFNDGKNGKTHGFLLRQMYDFKNKK
jgi:hypothetical protein